MTSIIENKNQYQLIDWHWKSINIKAAILSSDFRFSLIYVDIIDFDWKLLDVAKVGLQDPLVDGQTVLCLLYTSDAADE